MKKIICCDKEIEIFCKGSNKMLPVIILNCYGKEGNKIYDECIKLNVNNFILVSISNINWNNEMTPWYSDKIFQKEDNYHGEADIYLKKLENDIIPKIKEIIEKEFDKNISKYVITGYSLGGLFAIYSCYRSNLFASVVSCSGSLWYPNFIKFVKENDFLSNIESIYLSLGDKESKTNNSVLKTVGNNTLEVFNHYKNLNYNIMYEENIGNHFQDAEKRVAKGISWILNNN